MKKTLVIMGTYPKGLKLFGRSIMDCDIWTFNETPNVNNEKVKLMYPKTDVAFQPHHVPIEQVVGNNNNFKSGPKYFSSIANPSGIVYHRSMKVYDPTNYSAFIANISDSDHPALSANSDLLSI
jgi:hypothetical protein